MYLCLFLFSLFLFYIYYKFRFEVSWLRSFFSNLLCILAFCGSSSSFPRYLPPWNLRSRTSASVLQTSRLTNIWHHRNSRLSSIWVGCWESGKGMRREELSPKRYSCSKRWREEAKSCSFCLVKEFCNELLCFLF